MQGLNSSLFMEFVICFLNKKNTSGYFTLNPYLATVINSPLFKEKREGGTVSAETLCNSCVLLQISPACSNKVSLSDKHTWRKLLLFVAWSREKQCCGSNKTRQFHSSFLKSLMAGVEIKQQYTTFC